MEPEEIPAVLRIPRPLQERFYELAREEAARILQAIRSLDPRFLEPFEEVVGGAKRGPRRVEWRDSVFAVVDGSDSPSIDERIGLKYGLSAAGSKLFRGMEALEDGEYFVGEALRGRSDDSREEFLKKLDLVTVYLERRMALRALERADYVVLDGSFFGFRAGCSRVKEQRLDWLDPFTHRRFWFVHELIDELVGMTEELIGSGRALGVVKRIATSALDGYVGYRFGPDRMLGLTDRSILMLVTSPGDVVEYSSVFDRPHEVYSLLRSMLDERSGEAHGEALKRDLAIAERRFRVQLESDLIPERVKEGRAERREQLVRLIGSTERVFVRTVESQPPVCIELPRTAPRDLKDLAITYALETFNPATGLPLALDLVDELVSFPRALSREFVEEVEAELLRKGIDLRRLRALFSRINPQKEFE
ncbi:MAG: DNA double-strand break repair nuclease NurA [Candidatus Caldarchaeales archaeon]